MTVCPQSVPAPFVCPTANDIARATAKLWPQGRAWPITHDPSLVDRFAAWLAALAPDAQPAPGDWPAGFVQAGFSKSIADVFAYAAARWCALREEFWCATQVETRDLWMQEYGLPDACEPFPDLCVKVAALGGQTCAFFNEIAAANGWVIDCIAQVRCGAQAGCSQAGCGQVANGAGGVNLELVVHLDLSTSYVASTQTPPLAGLLQCGQPMACGPDISPFECLIDRIAPAHVVVTYTTVREPRHVAVGFGVRAGLTELRDPRNVAVGFGAAAGLASRHDPRNVAVSFGAAVGVAPAPHGASRRSAALGSKAGVTSHH